MARRRMGWAWRFSSEGQHAWAIDAADEAVALWRPFAHQQPAGMALALAVRATCLHPRGRTDDAARDVEECLAYWDRADGLESQDDRAAVVSMLPRAGRPDTALALAVRLLAEVRASPRLASLGPVVAYGEALLRHGRAEDAIPALREAREASDRLSRAQFWVSASTMLFEALAEAGRIEELGQHAHRDLGYFAFHAWGSVRGRLRYIQLLELLERHHVSSDRLPPLAATIAKQRRKLLRQQRRRWVLAAAFAVLTGNSRDIADPPTAPTPPDPARVAALARIGEAEAAVEQCRESGDAQVLSHAWGVLAEARWQAGGQRTAALDAQRTALAQTRRWAAQDPDGARSALIVHLRRFADYAGVIGLGTDARAARTEAEELTRAEAPDHHRLG